MKMIPTYKPKNTPVSPYDPGYEELKQRALERKRDKCPHQKWSKRCASCGKILDSDALCKVHDVDDSKVVKI